MPRGRKPAHASPTRFLNTKRRVIYRSETGKYFAKTEKGTKVYNPAAKFHKSPGGTERATKYLKNMMTIPSPIRPKFERRMRKNAGMPRGKYAPRVKGVRVLPVKRRAYITEMFEGHAPKRPVGRPRKHLVSPGGNMGLAKLFGGKPVRKPRARKMLYKVKLGGQYVA
jgi:hypothetical protein